MIESPKNELIRILACPKCGGGLRMFGGASGLLCRSCRVIYPITDGIPVMLDEWTLQL